jgi:peptidoglycan/LPS O-acetylase OafA/YrhL
VRISDHPVPIRGEIRSLTGLRGVAALYVVLYHYFGVSTAPGYSAFNTIRSHGYLAVDLFFVLSGVVISLNYAPKFYDRVSVRDYLHFLANRMARVYPLYAVVTLGCLAIGFEVSDRPITNVDVLLNLLMVQAWGPSISIAGPSWSISTEFAAYLIFPIIVLLVLRGRRLVGAVASAAAVVGLLVLGSLPEVQLHMPGAVFSDRHGPLDIYADGTVYPLVRCLAGFTLGVFACRMLRWTRIAALVRKRWTGDAVALATIALLAIPGSDIAVVLACMLLIVTLAAERSITARVLGWRPVHWLGLISYSLYLFHSPMHQKWLPIVSAPFTAAHVPHGGGIALALTIASVIALSAASYYAIERPARLWLRRFSGSRRLPLEVAPTLP